MIKTIDIENVEDLKSKVSDVKVFGNTDIFRLVSKASSEKEEWMKSTKIMNLPKGMLVQVTTQQGVNVAEALQYVPGVYWDFETDKACTIEY